MPPKQKVIPKPAPRPNLRPTSKPSPPVTQTATPAQENELKVPSFSETKDFVKFLIGPSETPEPFLVHKSFVCHYSSVLNAAFNGKFIEGQTQTYKLESTTAGAFGLFVEWLYTQKLRSTTQKGDWPSQYMSLVHLWVLADKFLLPRLQNHAIDALDQVRAISGKINNDCFDFVYQNIAVGSPLRRILIDFCVWDAPDGAYSSADWKFSEQMLRDLCCSFRDIVKSPKAAIDRKQRKMADFHVIEDKNDA